MSQAARQRAIVIAAISLLVAGILLAQMAETGSEGERPLGADPNDSGPTGLLGLTLLLERNDHDVERVAEAPSAEDLDAEKTAFLVAPGALTAADANALNELASDGGRVVVAGDPGDEGLSRLLGTDADISEVGVSEIVAPLVVAPETQGVASVQTGSTQAVEDFGGALPILGADGESTAVVADVGAGRVVVVADDDLLLNELIADADNALFGINLAGEAGRDVQLVEAVRTPPGSGLEALPSQWGWVALGLLAAAFSLAWARGRRLGPAEIAARPLPPPRRQYLDAVSGAMMRAGQPHAAAEPIRKAARDRLTRRVGLPPDASDAQIRQAAEAVGLEPGEVEALAGEGAMLAAAGALAKLEKRS
ncbi:MAG TPA: DUF4350 domain-containing protein [Solirubrobacterales bacterium]|nr:DUF4350 domain-containing protein [Solirubrobacterales bacterium]